MTGRRKRRMTGRRKRRKNFIRDFHLLVQQPHRLLSVRRGGRDSIFLLFGAGGHGELGGELAAGFLSRSPSLPLVLSPLSLSPPAPSPLRRRGGVGRGVWCGGPVSRFLSSFPPVEGGGGSESSNIRVCCALVP
eukprot:CAMPEP_0184293646 /NCGR_PEP_ID=MMETSP1049-20130417/5017_1 /TAXON_ID=77928 /ORGANISM="Proteomonas sulcata, Strain CCMP704" /LENGTH=133 /DNA_ID=CAMNT_0026601671 /DNA_START=342 /DNA_END=739 /DNA_ORIENTATION=-